MCRQTCILPCGYGHLGFPTYAFGISPFPLAIILLYIILRQSGLEKMWVNQGLAGNIVLKV